MKIRVTMKNPDCVSDAIQEAAEESVGEALDSGLDRFERDELIETRKDKFKAILGKWFEYEEYLTVEVDTEAKTIRVLEV